MICCSAWNCWRRSVPRLSQTRNARQVIHMLCFCGLFCWYDVCMPLSQYYCMVYFTAFMCVDICTFVCSQSMTIYNILCVKSPLRVELTWLNRITEHLCGITAWTRVCQVLLLHHVSHTRTVVRECCKGDDESQWERGKLDPRHPKTP